MTNKLREININFYNAGVDGYTVKSTAVNVALFGLVCSF